MIRSFFLLFAILPFIAFSQNLYVAPDGNDSNSGTLEKPYQTISKAAFLLEPGDTCFIRGGTYRETIRPKKSGTRDAPIVFMSYQDEDVILSGTETINKYDKDGDYYRASAEMDLGNNNQLFVDGKMQTLARWPNVNDNQLMTPEGASIDKGGLDWFICSALPNHYNQKNLAGGTIWMLMGKKWTSQTSSVVRYDPGEKRVYFEPFPKNVSRYMSPGVTNWGSDEVAGTFYISGVRADLDHAGEWFYQEDNRELLFIPPPDFKPSTSKIEYKVRRYVLDLSQRAHVQVHGVKLFAASANLEIAENCVLKGIDAAYISHTIGGFTSYSLDEDTGILISGTGNVLRDSKIFYSAGNGIKLSGASNQVVNNEIAFTDYIGNYAAPLKISGTGHLISHNSIHDTGRDCIQISGGEHLIQYNDIYHAGWIAHDLGMTYIVNQDGRGTEIHHNWFHDNLFKGGTSMGLYLDNFTANFLIHHNVMWGTADDGMRFNRPEQYTRFFNNTVIGTISHWGRWDDDDMTGLMLANNIVTDGIQQHPDMILVRNYTGNVNALNPEERKFQLPENAMLRDQGIVIKGITDHISDGRPDLGAYEFGEIIWIPGPDFKNPPFPEYKLTDVFWKNYIKNGSFEIQPILNAESSIPLWKISEQNGVQLNRGEGGISMNPDKRSTRIGNFSVQLNPGASIHQSINDIEAGRSYHFYGWTKSLESGGSVDFQIHISDDTKHSTVEVFNTWSQNRFDFSLSSGQNSVKVKIVNTGNLPVFIEDIGIYPVFF